MSRQPSRKPESGNKVTSQTAMKALRRKLPGRVFVDEKSCFDASLDNLRLSFLPDAVVKVQTATEVGAVLKLAHKYTIPVTARGAGSSATGFCAPVRRVGLGCVGSRRY